MDHPTGRTRYDWIIEALSILGLALSFLPLLFYNKLGEGHIIPIHYNAAGEIDGWGTRSMLWILPLIALACYVGLSLLEKFHKKLNYPLKITPDNAIFVYRLGVQLVRHLKLCFMLLFAYLNNTSLVIAMRGEGSLSTFAMMAFLGAILVTTIVYYVKMSQFTSQ